MHKFTFAFLLAFSFLVLFSLYSASAQVTKIMGTVVDEETKQPIPFANLVLSGISVGATTDFEGRYSIETRNPKIDTLVITYIGYETKKIAVTKNIFQQVDIELNPSGIMLNEVEILPGENPAEVILRKIIANKENNNRQHFDSYQYEVYSKVQFDINNVNEKLKDKKLLKPFRFIFDYVDTSTVNGKAYLPFFISESVSEVFYQDNPRVRKEYIKATRMSGPKNESISQFFGELYQNVNVYDNYIMLFEKNFVSPVANFSLLFYKYYLVDSSFIDNQWCYQIMFKPRRKQELTFTGEFWVNDTSWAIKSVNMKNAQDANINFINNITIKQDYDNINDQYWMITRDNLIIDFNVIENSKNTLGMFGHKTSMYRNFIFNQPKPPDFYNSPQNVYVEEGSFEKSRDYWIENRHESLTIKEQAIYDMVDSIKKLPVFRTWVDAFYLFTNGYLVWGPLEIGPLYKSLSFNPVEGMRLRIGGRTSNDFSKTLIIDGHLAYGTADRRLKYGAGLLYMISKNPRRTSGISYTNDLEQLGQSMNAFSVDNLFASFFRRNPPDKLSLAKEVIFTQEHEWFSGFSNKLNLIHRNVQSYNSDDFVIINNEGPVEKKSFTTSEIRIDLRFAHNEKFINGEFERISLGTVYPVLEVQFGLGVPDLLGGEYQYQRLQLGLKQWFNVGPFGWSKYIIEAGKTWGKLPYPLLKLHPGNETFIFDEYAYNLMNYYEFISDEYLSIYYTHHFDGFFLNRIPLMRKLNWREVAFVQGVIGHLSEENKNYSKFPEQIYTLEKPYIEAGVGIENIVKVYIIGGVIKPYEGRVYLENINITRQPMYKRAQLGIGYLAQEASVFRQLSVEDNIRAVLEFTKFSKAEQKNRLNALIEEFGLSHVRKSKGITLSGGERRRTEIARALAVDPKFILLDEPFAGVDPIAVEDIQEIVSKLKDRNIGVLITDHNVHETLSITDRSYLLFEGSVLKSGTSEELADDEHVRKVYLGEKFELRR